MMTTPAQVERRPASDRVRAPAPALRRAPRSRKRRTVVVAVDLDKSAARVLKVAHREAMRLNAELVALHVVSPMRHAPVFPHLAASALVHYPGMVEEAGEQLRRLVLRCTHRRPSTFQARIESGVVHFEVARVARELEAAVVVLGRTRSADLTTALLGGTPERVMRFVECSVLVAGKATAARSVLAATDLGHAGVPVVRQAALEAERRGAPLIILHTFGKGPSPSARQRAWTRIEGQLASFTTGPIKQADVVVTEGDPVTAIQQVVSRSKCGLVVVGTHRRRGMRRILEGSIAEQVVNRTDVNVLITPLRDDLH